MIPYMVFVLILLHGFALALQHTTRNDPWWHPGRAGDPWHVCGWIVAYSLPCVVLWTFWPLVLSWPRWHFVWSHAVVWVCAGRPEGNLPKIFFESRCERVFGDEGLPGMGPDDVRAMLLESTGSHKYDLIRRDREEGTELHNPFVRAVVERASGLPLYVHHGGRTLRRPARRSLQESREWFSTARGRQFMPVSCQASSPSRLCWHYRSYWTLAGALGREPLVRSGDR